LNQVRLTLSSSADPSATTPNHVYFSSVASACRTVLDALAIGTSVVAVALPFGFYFYSGFYIHVVSTLGSAETKKRLGRTRKETWTDSKRDLDGLEKRLGRTRIEPVS